jgi:hypothetical protein
MSKRQATGATSSGASNGGSTTDIGSERERGASAATSTRPLGGADEHLSDAQLRVLYELNAIKAILDDINATLQTLVETTAPGGRLYDAQQIALGSFVAWERLFDARSKQS